MLLNCEILINKNKIKIHLSLILQIFNRNLSFTFAFKNG